MNPGLLFLAGVATGSLVTWGLHSDHYARCRRLLALVTRKRQASREDRQRSARYLDYASCELNRAIELEAYNNATAEFVQIESRRRTRQVEPSVN
jgi:hypothetical protein